MPKRTPRLRFRVSVEVGARARVSLEVSLRVRLTLVSWSLGLSVFVWVSCSSLELGLGFGLLSLLPSPYFALLVLRRVVLCRVVCLLQHAHLTAYILVLPRYTGVRAFISVRRKTAVVALLLDDGASNTQQRGRMARRGELQVCVLLPLVLGLRS